MKPRQEPHKSDSVQHSLWRNLAGNVGLTTPVLEVWLQTYVRVRNVCAHHGRLWNLGVGVYPAIPNSPTISWLNEIDALNERSPNRLYPRTGVTTVHS
ncbi:MULTISPECIES: Abi family protein [Nocardiaceae]|uniref:Abi family protein n=1 Tax=Nocardiaceae TaxID=85025 RepID=UPI0034CEBCD4